MSVPVPSFGGEFGITAGLLACPLAIPPMSPQYNPTQTIVFIRKLNPRPARTDPYP